MYEVFNQDILNSLNESERVVFDYVRNNYLKVQNFSIRKLAEETFVSKTTIVRMSKKLGFEGFTEFRYFLKSLDTNSVETVDIDKIKTMRKLDCEMSLNMIDPTVLDEVVEMIRTKKIYLFGMGLSFLPCSYMSLQLSLLCVNVSATEQPHIALELAKNFNKDDVLFIFSASGETEQTIRLTNIAKETSATIVTVTEPSSNTVSQNADYSFYVMMNKDGRVSFDNRSRTPMFLFVQNLIDVYIDKFF